MEYNINVEKFRKQYNKEYDFLYNNHDNVAGYSEAVNAFDDLMKSSESFVNFVREYVINVRHCDPISSDRECAAFMFALDVLAE